MGKEKYVPVVLDADEEKFGVAKIMKLGIVVDERITDGLYFGNSFREMKRILDHPFLLDSPIDARIEDQK
jgi:pyruvate/2-oxoglutarate dehydrogenase complex dihydrolipoamide acyltransferase (E2) component